MVVRETFAVGLIAGVGVDLAELAGIVGGGAPPGFSLLSRDAVTGAEVGEENALAMKLKEQWEEEKAKTENPEMPMPKKLFGCLLATVLSKAAEPPAEVPDDDEASSALLRIPGGPKSVRITLDVPQDVEEARAFCEGGGLDAVLIIRKPAPAPTEQSDEAAADTAPVDPEVQEKGMRAENLYSDLQALGKEQYPDGHNPTADTFFSSIEFEGDAAGLLQKVAQVLIAPAYHRQEYAKWLEGVGVVQMPTHRIDLRHYDETLSKVPHACLSVPIILNALLEQVCVNEADPTAENRDLRQVWADNKRIVGPLEEAFASLAGTPSPPAPTDAEVGKGALVAIVDERSLRFADPRSLESSKARDAIAGGRQCESDFSLALDIARLFPAEAEVAAAATLSEDAVLRSLPEDRVTPDQARHGLLLVELEQLLGVECDDSGSVKASGARAMEDMSMHKMAFREELGAEQLQQQLATAVLKEEPEVVTRYYPREDALIVALCALVPKGRLSQSSWKSPMCAHLGFTQWLEARQAAKTAAGMPEEIEPEVAEAVPQEITPGAEGGQENSGEEAGEGDEEKPKPRKEYKMPQLPVPDQPVRLFDLDAQRAATFDEQSVMVMSEGTKVVSGRRWQGRYVRWHTQSHSVHMREQEPAGQGAAGWAVSITYEDGACLILREVSENGEKRRVCASLSSADGVHVTLDGGKAGDGIVWRSVPHARAGGTRAPLGWAAASGMDVEASLDSTPKSSAGEEAAADETAETDDARKPPKPVPELPKGAPADLNPKEMESCMVLPAAGRSLYDERWAGGAQVIRKADGTARALLPDGSTGWYGGEGRGWEWTNSQGLRQGKVPQFPGQPQHRDRISVALEGDARSGGFQRWREDGVSQVSKPIDVGLEEICLRFADGSVSTTVPAKGTTTVVREGVGEVWVGPAFRETRVRLEDGSEMAVDANGVLRVKRLGDCAEVECEIESGAIRFYSAGRPEGFEVPPGGNEDLLSQQVRSAGPGCFFMDIFKGHLRAVDTSKHLYMVAEGTARVVLDGEAVPAPSDAPLGPSDGTESGQLAAVSSDGSERLEPLRVFVIRRNGTGYELHAADAAAAAMQRARRAGQMVLEETRGDGGWCTIIAPDDRGLIHQADAERGLPPSLRYVSQRPTGGRGKEGILWRQMVRDCRQLDAGVFAELRKLVQASFDAVLEERSANEGDDSPFVVKVREAIHAQRNSRGGQEEGLEWVKGKLALLRDYRPPADPTFPAVVRPPVKPSPAKFKGVKPPEEPSVLRPRYFDSAEGSAFLDSLGPEGRMKITKEKRPWKINLRGADEDDPNLQDEEGEEEDEENEDLGGLPSMQQYHQQQEMSMERRSQGQMTRGSASGNFQRPTDTAQSGVSLPRQPTTNYHLKHLRPAHYDVLNRPRKIPEPDTTRFDADPEPHERNLRLEKPVSRRVHTSSVLLKTMLDHARGSDALSIEDSVLEGGPHRSFRLRPRRAGLGQLRQGNLYRFKMVLSNCGVEACRFRVRQPDDGNGGMHPSVSLIYSPGAVAPGMSVVVEVEVWADECGLIDTEAAIETETEVFFVPISAVVLDSQQFEEWQVEGGQLPCNVTAVDQPPKRKVRAKAPTVATLRKQLAAKREAEMHGASAEAGGKIRDLQDPVPEPSVPSTATDWFVDKDRHLSEIKEMTARERARERKIQALKRRGRPVNEATLAGIEAELKLQFNSPRAGGTGGTAGNGGEAAAEEEPTAGGGESEQPADAPAE